MNEALQRQRERVQLDGLVVETGKTRNQEGQDVPFTVLYVGRFIDNITLFRNGLTVGEVVKLSGELVDMHVRTRSGKDRRITFVAKPEIEEA